MGYTVLSVIVSVPCILAVFCAWKLHRWEAARQKAAAKQEEEHKEQDEARKQHDFLVIKGVGASISLGEAIAKAVQQLPVECNGEMKQALDYARDTKREQKEFLQKQGIESLH